jgi:two-component system nitrate/nitrite response regulator NarP
MAETVEVIVADSNSLMLSALSETFNRDPRFALISTIATAEAFLTMAIRMPVHVAVVDWSLPSLGGQRLLEVLRDQPNPPACVVYADDRSGETARRAMAAGAAGFCARSAPVDELLDVCAQVASGRMVFPFLDVRGLQEDPIFQLTKRERSMLETMAEGRTNKELAAEFNLSVNTVKFHLSNLYDKLGVKNRTQAIAFYFSSRLQGDWKAPE